MLDEAKNIDLRRSNKTAPGSICFDYGERKFGDFLSFCNTSFSMVPQTGLLIIFPAYLTHHAYAFQTTCKCHNSKKTSHKKCDPESA